MNRESRAFIAKAHTAFRNLVLQPGFSCLGAKAALNENAYAFRAFHDMGSRGCTQSLARSLSLFAHSELLKQARFSSFVAVFHRPLELTEREFETALWLQLRQLHRLDEVEWDPQVSADSDDPRFSFSFAGRAFYVIGMHANSSRTSRRFQWPTLVFNPRDQFERLRSEGNWKRMQESIRAREVAVQGKINPMLADFGERSEARQYSGREVSEEWRAPFRAEKKCPFAH
jgi:FPC/CPF motif-containing protein YcgG